MSDASEKAFRRHRTELASFLQGWAESTFGSKDAIIFRWDPFVRDEGQLELVLVSTMTGMLMSCRVKTDGGGQHAAAHG